MIRLCLATLLLSGCAHWHLSNAGAHQKTVQIPYAEGDSTGEFTRRVIAEVSKQPGYSVDDTGQYRLAIKLLDSKEQKMGYRYDPIAHKKGENVIILNESRSLALVEVSLIDTFSNTIVLGPIHILGSADYDHQENTIDQNTNNLSLGQLTDADTAEDVVYIPLYRDIAMKISSWLQNAQEFATITK